MISYKRQPRSSSSETKDAASGTCRNLIVQHVTFDPCVKRRYADWMLTLSGKLSTSSGETEMTKANRAEVLTMVHDIIKETTEEPADAIIAMGEALTKIGEALQGVSTADAKAIIRSTMELHGIQRDASN